MIITAKENLLQIKGLVECLTSNDYTFKSEVLSGSTIGQHLRHILEFYLLLLSGSLSGTINYDKRDRNPLIETDKNQAIKTIDKLIAGLHILNESDVVIFESDYSKSGKGCHQTLSSVGRELAYCIEHSIHHQALIKAGLIALDKNYLVDTHFGVAYSTLRYRNNTCAQ